MKTILLTDVSSALDFSHTVSKDKYTSKHMNNTIQKRRLGGGGVHDTYTNLLENLREKTKCTVVWFFVAIIKYIFIYWLIQSLCLLHREQSGLWLWLVRHTAMERIAEWTKSSSTKSSFSKDDSLSSSLFSSHLNNFISLVFLVNQVKETVNTLFSKIILTKEWYLKNQ